MRKDENKISCMDASSNGKVLVSGTEDGTLQIISNPESYWLICVIVVIILLHELYLFNADIVD